MTLSRSWKRAAGMLACLSALMTGTFSAAPAQETFPARPVQLLVPFPPGASTDLLARFLAPKLSAALGQPVVVENRGGAGGLIGAGVVAKAAPDGHTLLVASSTTMQSPLLQKNPAFDTVKDFAPVIAAFQHPFLMVSSATIPVHNIAELIQYAKANPGKLNAASLGGFSDVISMMFRHAAGLQLQIVPYRGGAEAMIGVVRGDAHIVFNPYSAMQPQIQSGQLRMMAVTSLQRSPTVPDVPTLAESGLKDFEIINVVGILAPAGTPQPIVQRLNREIAAIVSSPEGRKFITDRGNDTIPDYSPDHYAKLLKAADTKYRRVIDEIGFVKQ
ncbi:MAG: tripartite tricarboxylate transporter substrate binding protein [Rhizobiales bacterium]|nr:tripartite tricarboxylate transporter substrate binding protein [Hyphomicrobiales bacterium]OJY47021.1 MAG: hypothetical protein BGP08_03170 [Rhizobiales bacterium 64-17]